MISCKSLKNKVWWDKINNKQIYKPDRPWKPFSTGYNDKYYEKLLNRYYRDLGEYVDKMELWDKCVREGCYIMLHNVIKIDFERR